MKKKTMYKWMTTILGLTIILYAIIYFFHLQDDAVKVASKVKAGKPTLSFYIQGDVSDPLNKPMDVTKVGEYIYVSDTNHQQVQVFDSSGNPVFKFGKKGTEKGQFQFPYGIAGDKKGNVYVNDLYNGKISVFTPKGKFIKYFTDSEGKTDFIKSPGGLRIYNNILYITDIQGNKVVEYSMSGKKLLEIKTASNDKDALNAPNAVAIDNDKNIYISDSGNQRIVVCDKKGKFLRTVNGSADNTGGSKFVNPRGIGVEENGTLLVIDNMTHYVFGFDAKGKKVFQIGGMGSEKNQFYLPNGLFISGSGQIFITDTVNQRIGVYY